MELTISTHGAQLIEYLANTSVHCGDGRGSITEMVAADKALTAYIASLEADKDRLDTAQKLLVGFDAEWGADGEKIPVVMLEIPKGVRIGMDLRKFLNDAKSSIPQGTPPQAPDTE